MPYPLNKLPILIVMAAGLALAACSGTQLSNYAGAPAAGTGDAAATLATGALPAKAAFDPFSTDDGTGPKAREIIANPTLAQVLQKGPMPEQALGRPDAPVTIIKYASLTCPYCRRFQRTVFPTLKRDYIDTGKVRFIIREFPIGRQSGTATIAWRCAPQQAYFTLYEKFLFSQPQWVSQEVRTAPILKIAAQTGLTAAQFDSCLKDAKLVEGLKAVKQRGRLLGVIGTPNFFINNKLVKSTVTIESLRAMIDPLLAGRVAVTTAPTPR